MSSWFSAFYKNHNKLKMPNLRFQCRNFFLHQSHFYELWNLKKMSYVKDSLHLKWMHTHSYEPRVMAIVITVENHQSVSSFNYTNKLTVPWIHSNMFHLSSGSHKYCRTISTATGMWILRYASLGVCNSSNFC